MYLQLHYFNILLGLSHLGSSLPSPPQSSEGDIQSLQGLTTLTHDHSGRRGDPPEKYFHEATFHSHYDGRFAAAILPYADSKHHLRILLQTYLSTMHDLGVETWIMHGSLLGWWWNRKVMPWDSDVDVQVSETSLEFLASYHNMTVHRFPIAPDLRAENGDGDGDGGADEKNEKKEKEKEKGRSYLLEINPHYRNGSVSDTLNVIDARWIDMTTGLFIDITGLRRDREAEQAGRPGQMMCKDRHQYMYDDIFPLRDSVFEGVPARVPFKYIELLEQEYGKTALTKTEYEGHVFEQQTMEWKPRSG